MLLLRRHTPAYLYKVSIQEDQIETLAGRLPQMPQTLAILSIAS